MYCKVHLMIYLSGVLIISTFEIYVWSREHDIGKNALSTFWPSTNQVVFIHAHRQFYRIINLSSTVTIVHVLMIIA